MKPTVRVNIFFKTNFTKNLFQVKDKEKKTLEKMENARQIVRNEINDLKERLKFTQDKMQLLKDKIETDDLAADDAL